MKRPIVLFALLLVAIAAQSSFAQTQKQFVVQTARALETSPLDKATIKSRSEAVLWIIQTDDLTISICGSVLDTALAKKNKNSTDMMSAYMIGMAAYKIQNPDKLDDDSVQLAGLELSLKVYEAMVKEKPKTKFEPVESLIAKRNSGELAAFVTSVSCYKKSDTTTK